MGSIIVAMPKMEDAKKISEMLKSRGLQTIEICTTGSGILSKVHNLDYGIVICTRKYKDMCWNEIADNLPDYFEMLLLISKESIEEYQPDVQTIPMPFRVIDFVNEVERTLRRLDRCVGKRSGRPQKRSKEEQAYIDKAKRILMDRNHMTEPEAFRYIQKSSMDACTSMVETSKRILDNFAD